MEQTWESLFKEKALASGHSEEFIRKCIEYGSILRQNNLPVIFDVQHLVKLLGDDKLAQIHDYSWAYSDYEIKKKHGVGVRRISAPHPFLLGKQEWILKNILEHLSSRLSPHVHGFIKGRSTITNAKPHEGAQWIINIDLKDFFGTIHRNKVVTFFQELNYTEEVSRLLSIICTKSVQDGYGYVLPQGAPTSPMLANFIATPLDDDLSKLAVSNDCVYTRYADDITFLASKKDVQFA